jgi:anti-sigma factor RsiW
MADPARLALIHAEIDGELDARQRADLARSLLADPETRALREDLKRLCTALDAVQEVEPPPQLRASILAALPQTHAPPARSWWSAPALRYAAVLAGVVAASAVVFGVLDGQRPAASDVAGTLAQPRAATTLDTIQLANGPVVGRVSLTRDGAALALAFELKASAPVDVFVASGGYTFRINGLGRQDGPGAGRTTVALPGFRMDGQAVDLTFLMAGQEIGRATLRATTGH